MPYSRLVLLAMLLVAPTSWAQETRREFNGPSGPCIAERRKGVPFPDRFPFFFPTYTP